MAKMPQAGLYRTTKPLPGHEQDVPAGVLVYIGSKPNDDLPFVVRPQINRRNRWFWADPTLPLRSVTWGDTLIDLPAQGFYTLPDELRLDGGGVWVKGAIVQLGYNGDGKGILFVAEDHEESADNALYFSDRGVLITDDLMKKLKWAAILPVSKKEE